MLDNHQADAVGEHLTDLDIVLESDGELTQAQARRIREHLSACWSCRTRKVELDRGVADFVHLYREKFDKPLPPAEQPKRLLEAHLNEASRTVKSAPWWRAPLVAKTLTSAAVSLVLGVVAAVVVSQHPFRQVHVGLVSNALPNPELSPGVASAITRQQVCKMQNIEDDRLTGVLARQVFQRYRIAEPAAGAFEVDYVVPPALGGRRSAENLWPQPYGQGEWNSHTKDALEQRLEGLVCSGQLDLRQAQAALSRDWIGAYKTYFHSTQPLLDHVAFVKDRPWPVSTQNFGN